VTSSPTSTSEPGLESGDGSSSGSGLGSKQKHIIIGVVVGLGGAALLGGLAVVAWRIWGRNRRHAEENDELMAASPEVLSKEKRSSTSGHSQFRSPADQYRSAPLPVNAAANF